MELSEAASSLDAPEQEAAFEKYCFTLTRKQTLFKSQSIWVNLGLEFQVAEKSISKGLLLKNQLFVVLSGLSAENFDHRRYKRTAKQNPFETMSIMILIVQYFGFNFLKMIKWTF